MTKTQFTPEDVAFAKFGVRLFDKLFDAFCDGQFEIELFDLIQIDAVSAGLVEKVPLDPELHADWCDCCEPGDDYYTVTLIGRKALAKARGEQSPLSGDGE